VNRDRSFGHWLRQRRRELDLTQEQLASRIGCSTVMLHKLETEERRPSQTMVERLADVLQVTQDERPTFLRFARGDPFAAPVSLKPQHAFGAPRHNLPIQLTSLIGREKEMAEIHRLLSIERLVTLTGAGGTGKTRLALEAASGLLDEYADGTWLVELAPLTDAGLVPRTVAQALGLRMEAGRTVHEELRAFHHFIKAGPLSGLSSGYNLVPGGPGRCGGARQRARTRSPAVGRCRSPATVNRSAARAGSPRHPRTLNRHG
jgi:transcriptional regulator with XRE-family HTH domain